MAAAAACPAATASAAPPTAAWTGPRWRTGHKRCGQRAGSRRRALAGTVAGSCHRRSAAGADATLLQAAQRPPLLLQRASGGVVALAAEAGRPLLLLLLPLPPRCCWRRRRHIPGRLAVVHYCTSRQPPPPQANCKPAPSAGPRRGSGGGLCVDDSAAVHNDTAAASTTADAAPFGRQPGGRATAVCRCPWCRRLLWDACRRAVKAEGRQGTVRTLLLLLVLPLLPLLPPLLLAQRGPRAVLFRCHRRRRGLLPRLVFPPGHLRAPAIAAISMWPGRQAAPSTGTAKRRRARRRLLLLMRPWRVVACRRRQRTWPAVDGLLSAGHLGCLLLQRAAPLCKGHVQVLVASALARHLPLTLRSRRPSGRRHLQPLLPALLLPLLLLRA